MALVDAKSRFGIVYLLHKKSEASGKLQGAITFIESHFPGRKVRFLRSDGGGEFMSTAFQQWLRERG